MSTELINKVLRFGEGRGMKDRIKRVERINALEPAMQDLSDAQIRERADDIRARLADGVQLDDVLDERIVANDQRLQHGLRLARGTEAETLRHGRRIQCER